MKKMHFEKGLAVCLLGMAAASCAFASEYTWKGSASSSLFVPSNFTPVGSAPSGTVPGPGDTLALPADSAIAVDNDSVAMVGSLARIKMGARAVLTVSISTNAVMGCTISGTSTSAPYGSFVKEGSGTLTLASANGYSSSKTYLDCFTANFSVNGGDVVLPQGSGDLSSDKDYEMGNCTIAEGSTLFLPDTCGTWMAMLNGAGVVTNASSSTLRIKGSGVNGLFSGKIAVAGLSLEVYYDNTIDITGTENTFARDFAVNGSDVGVMDFGSLSSSASSIGLDAVLEIRKLGGTLRYLGSSPATIDKEISIYAADTGAKPFTMDGGAYGGLNITGKWGFFTNTKNFGRMRRIVVTGSNTAECVVANEIANASQGGTNYTFSITKKGSGIWRFANHASRNFRGSVAVDEGTLRFDSIDETNKVCSLGLATDTFGDLEGFKDEDLRLPYAIRLGSADAEGGFEYTGTGFAQTRTRAIGLAGDARIIHNGTAGFIRLFSGISAVTPGAKTLTLDGDGTVDCEISDISDGDGAISVVKDGDGIWALTGEQSFSGSLHVKKGTLFLRNPDRYNWYRLVIRENLGSTQTRLFEVGMFDTASNRVPLAAVSSSYANDRGNLQYGQAALARDASVAQNSYPFENLFDNSTGSSSHTRFQVKPVETDDTKWIYIVMHTSADYEVSSFDYAPYNSGSYTDSGIKSLVLQASLDGGSWTNLYEKSNEPATAGAKWHYNVESFTAGGKHCGQIIDTTIPQEDRASCFMENVSTVRVDSGATLALQGDVTLSSLTASLSGAGTISGGALAAAGTLDLEGTMVGDSMAFPVTFTGVSGLENLPKWTLLLNGCDVPNMRVVMNDGVLMVKAARGFSVFVR